MSKIAIIIPSRASENEEITLKSLAKQTFKNFEIVVVKDFDNKGANWARNKGFEECDSEFVLFSDNDIKWESDGIENLYECLINNPDCSYSYGYYITANRIFANREFDAAALQRMNFISTMSLIRTKHFPGWDESICRLQDWDLWLMMLESGKVGKFCGKKIFETYVRNGITNGTGMPFEEAKEIVLNKHNMSKLSKQVPVLFTTYDRLEYTKLSLDALLKSDCGPIFIVDNGSTDGTKEWLIQAQRQNYDKIKLTFNDKNRGVAGAMNQFISENDFKFLAKVDNDTIVPEDWLRVLLPVLDVADIVQAKHSIIKDTFNGTFDEWMQTMKTSKMQGVFYNRFVGGSGIVFKRNVIGKLPEDGWVLGGWNKWQKDNLNIKKAFCSNVEIKLLDTNYDGSHKQDYKGYYFETGRKSIIFVTASHKQEILNKFLRKSKIFDNKKLIVKKGYTNVSKAYNDAKVIADIVVYVHHDVFLPDDFESNLIKSLDVMEGIDPNWGVLGVAGVNATKDGKDFFGCLKDREIEYKSDDLPVAVQTLDELILITHGDFKFDEKIPSNHFYGADICLQANKQGRKNYVINCFLIHNSSLRQGERPADFILAKKYFANKYKDQFPIATTCEIFRG